MSCVFKKKRKEQKNKKQQIDAIKMKAKTSPNFLLAALKCCARGRHNLRQTLFFVFADEHVDASEGGGHVVQPAELRQRLQQQQPPGRHPGLVAGVHAVMMMMMS